MSQTVELSSGGSRALIALEGQALIGLNLDGIEVMPDAKNAKSFFAGSVLAPWPNRIKAGKYSFAGSDFQLDTNDGLDNALHGLIYAQVAKISKQDEDSVTLVTTLLESAQYPWRLEIQTTYNLDENGLKVSHSAKNLGDAKAPVGLGVHPYFVAPSGSKLLVNASSAGRRETDMIPEVYEDVQALGLHPDLATKIQDLHLDNEFTELDFVDGLANTQVIYEDGTGFSVWQEKAEYLMIYTCEKFPFDSGVAAAIAIEPQTCGANAFNNGRGLKVLEPGEEFGFRWGVSLLSGDEGNL